MLAEKLLAEYFDDLALVERHKTAPAFFLDNIRWAEFSAEALAFAAEQSMAIGFDFCDGLPPGWLSTFVAASAYHGAFCGKQFRRPSSWVPRQIRTRDNVRTDLPDGRAEAVDFVVSERAFVAVIAFGGRLSVWRWPVDGAIAAARQTLARTVVAPRFSYSDGDIVTVYSVAPQRVVYPHAMEPKDEQRARAAAASFVGDDSDVAVWLVHQTLRGNIGAYCSAPGVRAEPCAIADLPEEMQQEASDVATMLDFFLERYPCDDRPIGRIVGQRYYLWEFVGDEFIQRCVAIDDALLRRVAEWKENKPVVIPASVHESTFRCAPDGGDSEWVEAGRIIASAH